MKLKTKKGLIEISIFELLTSLALGVLVFVLSGSVSVALIIFVGSIMYSLRSFYTYYQYLKRQEKKDAET